MLLHLLAFCSRFRNLIRPLIVLSLYVQAVALPATFQALRPTGSLVLLMARIPTLTPLATTLAATLVVD